MHHDYDFLIVGGGMVADAAAKGIREQGSEGTIGILGEEPTPPFPRPALSKKLWTDPDFTFDDAAMHTSEETGATFHLGSPVTGVDTEARTATTAAGDTFGYGTLLVATGGRPRRIEGLEPGDRVLYFRDLADYNRLRELAQGRPRVVVVGGGYIGSEIAAALSQHDCEVTVVHPGEVLGDHVFPDALARRFESLFTDAGVRVHGGLKAVGGRADGDTVVVELSDGSSLEADVVVVGLGISPDTDFLPADVARADDGGVRVDERLTTSVPGVLAAGDVAEYPDRILGRRRVEHVDNAGEMGSAVGRIMAGSTETYDHTPMFYSDVLGVGYEAVGTLDASLETVVDERDGGVVVYYLDDQEVRGVLLWDVEVDGGLDQARAVLAEHARPTDASALVGRVG